MEKIEIGKLPPELFDKIEDAIKPYVIGLMGVTTSTSGEDADIVGSGTLVQVKDRYGILTVRHVTRELKKFDRLGLNLGTFLHRFAINIQFLHFVELGDSRVGDEIGPDLAVILLPEIHVGTIKAKKSFWNLDHHAPAVLSRSFAKNLRSRFWTVSGFVGAWSRDGGPASGFDKTKICWCLSGFSGSEEYWEREEFDYLKLSVLYRNRTDLPATFGGMSGGAIWWAELSRTPEGKVSCSDGPLLLGVAFCETAIENNLRSIIGHGWRSIYEQVLASI